MTGKIIHGDLAARQVSERIGGVGTSAELAALPLYVLVEGQLYFCSTTETVYQYRSAAAASEGGIAVTAGGRMIPSGVKKRVLTITHADLTEDTNNTAQAINVGAALPAGANVLFAQAYLTTQFTGGSVSTCTMSLGISGATTALMNALNVLGGTAAAWYSVGGGTATRPYGNFSEAQVLATFTPDASHNLAALTAGSVTVEVLYAVP